jgi:hypothetical protein
MAEKNNIVSWSQLPNNGSEQRTRKPQVTRQDPAYFSNAARPNLDDYAEVIEERLEMVKFVGGSLTAALVGINVLKTE